MTIMVNGQCMNEARHAPASASSSASVEGESLPGRDGHGAPLSTLAEKVGGVAFFIALAVVSVLLGE